MGFNDHWFVSPKAGTQVSIGSIGTLTWGTFYNATNNVNGTTVLELGNPTNDGNTVTNSKSSSNVVYNNLCRTQADKDANNSVRDDLLRHVSGLIGAKTEGDNYIDAVMKVLGKVEGFKTAFKPEDFNKGKPLTVRRVRSILEFVNSYCRMYNTDDIKRNDIEDSRIVNAGNEIKDDKGLLDHFKNFAEGLGRYTSTMLSLNDKIRRNPNNMSMWNIFFGHVLTINSEIRKDKQNHGQYGNENSYKFLNPIQDYIKDKGKGFVELWNSVCDDFLDSNECSIEDEASKNKLFLSYGIDDLRRYYNIRLKECPNNKDAKNNIYRSLTILCKTLNSLELDNFELIADCVFNVYCSMRENNGVAAADDFINPLRDHILHQGEEGVKIWNQLCRQYSKNNNNVKLDELLIKTGDNSDNNNVISTNVSNNVISTNANRNVNNKISGNNLGSFSIFEQLQPDEEKTNNISNKYTADVIDTNSNHQIEKSVSSDGEDPNNEFTINEFTINEFTIFNKTQLNAEKTDNISNINTGNKIDTNSNNPIKKSVSSDEDDQNNEFTIFNKTQLNAEKTDNISNINTGNKINEDPDYKPKYGKLVAKCLDDLSKPSKGIEVVITNVKNSINDLSSEEEAFLRGLFKKEGRDNYRLYEALDDFTRGYVRMYVDDDVQTDEVRRIFVGANELVSLLHHFKTSALADVILQRREQTQKNGRLVNSEDLAFGAFDPNSEKGSAYYDGLLTIVRNDANFKGQNVLKGRLKTLETDLAKLKTIPDKTCTDADKIHSLQRKIEHNKKLIAITLMGYVHEKRSNELAKMGYKSIGTSGEGNDCLWYALKDVLPKDEYGSAAALRTKLMGAIDAMDANGRVMFNELKDTLNAGKEVGVDVLHVLAGLLKRPIICKAMCVSYDSNKNVTFSVDDKKYEEEKYTGEPIVIGFVEGLSANNTGHFFKVEKVS